MRQILGLIPLCGLLLASGCSSLFYHPTERLYFDPGRFSLKPEAVSFSSSNGKKLSGWYFQNRKNKKARAIVIFYHGNAENLSSHYLSLIWLLEHPYDFMIFDYQGYGQSEGQPSQKHTVADGEAALRWAAKRFPNIPLVIFGQSLGGAIALRNAIDLKKEIPLRLVVVDSTFASYRSMARRVMARGILSWPFQWLGWLLVSDEKAPDGEIHKISPIPLIVAHGTKDTIVEYEMGEEVFRQAEEPKEIWKIEAGLHTDIFARHEGKFRQLFLERLEKISQVN